jgi:8-oxo-dGTP pyrophosphatase MutT (NUDIX family)
MRRIERTGDPWSGQVSFPGGGEEEEDKTLLETARRECVEEVGIDLQINGDLLGRLDDVQAMSGGRALPMFIRPFVFELMAEVETELGPEAREVQWVPLNEIAPMDSEEFYEFQAKDRVIELPCWRYNGFTVWGLTRHMIHALFCLLKVR